MLEQIKQLISRYFSDMSRTQAETREGLEELIDYLGMMIESLD